MKRFLTWLILVILVFLMAGYGYYLYRQQHSYQSPVHREAVSLLKVHVDGLAKSVLLNMLANPGHYRQARKTKSARPLMPEPWQSGLKVPANLFFYTIKGQPADLFFCTLAISDSAAFNRYVREVFGIAHLSCNTAGICTGYSKDGRFAVAFSPELVALAVSFKKEATALSMLKVLLKQQDMIPVTESPLFESIKNDNHMNWSDGINTAGLNFEDGKITMDAVCRTKLLKGSDKFLPRKFAKGSLVKTWLNADIRGVLKKEEAALARVGIPADTLIRYGGGYMDFEWKDSTLIQADTVVAYGYDDNFERTAQQTIRRTKVPEMYFSWKSSPHLRNYLPGQLIYKLHTGHAGALLYTGTGNHFTQVNEQHHTDQFFYLFADIEKINKSGILPFLPAYVKPITTAEVSARNWSDGAVHMQGIINFINPVINSLSQLIKD